MKKIETIILPGMPHLEWMTENLSGFGGTEIDGRTYYTWEEAMAAVKQLGHGWRLPTREEFEKLCDLGSTQDDTRKGRWFGGNDDTDHKGNLFLPAAGYHTCEFGGTLIFDNMIGFYWTSSYLFVGKPAAGHLRFGLSYVDPLNDCYTLAHGFSVCCVRDVQRVTRDEQIELIDRATATRPGITRKTMKNIEKRADLFGMEDDDGFVVMNTEKRNGFKAGAEWMREELTRWHDPKEELPEPMKDVLVKCTSGTYVVDYYNPEFGCFFGEHIMTMEVIG